MMVKDDPIFKQLTSDWQKWVLEGDTKDRCDIGHADNECCSRCCTCEDCRACRLDDVSYDKTAYPDAWRDNEDKDRSGE